jgi:hypothetical protein
MPRVGVSDSPLSKPSDADTLVKEWPGLDSRSPSWAFSLLQRAVKALVGINALIEPRECPISNVTPHRFARVNL